MDNELFEKANLAEIEKAKYEGMSKKEIEIKKNKATLKKGRYSRSRFWIDSIMWFVLSIFILGNTLSYIGVHYFISGGNETIAKVLINTPYIAFLIFFLLISARRFNDLNKNSWFSLLILIPIINIGIFIWLGFFKGTEGDNDYGKDQLNK